MDDFMTLRQAAKRLGISVWTMRNRIKDGSILAVREGRRVLIHQNTIDAYIASLPRA